MKITDDELAEKLLEDISQRQKRITDLRWAGAPEVGIIYKLYGKLFIDSTPISEAEDYGDFKNHPGDHYRYWKSLSSVVPELGQYEYDRFPRGRAVYNKKKKQFYLYLDRCIMNEKSKILAEMHLPAKTIVSRDIHYQCSKCEYE